MRPATKAALAAVCVVLAACSSFNMRRADAAAERGDYETALELYHEIAENQVSSYARLQIAKIYEEGLAGEPDLAEARRWYQSSGDLGNAFAQYKAGELIESGTGGPADDAEAARYYTAAARQGEGRAALRLAEMTLAGRGVEPDPARARSLFEAAAAQGNLQAFYRLGQQMLASSDPETAKKGLGWLLAAAHEGHALAQTAVARAMRDGQGITVDRDVARQWFVEAAEQGNIAAQHELAGIERGQLTAQAREWRMASAKAGYIPAQIAVAQLCQANRAEPSCAAHWYGEAAKGGNAYAQYQMGRLSEVGAGVPRDLDAARRWYALAARGNMPAARERLRALSGS